MTVPSTSNHLAQARSNRAHAEWLFQVASNDATALQWAVTAAFYSALHGMTAHLIGCRVAVNNHTARSQALFDPGNAVPRPVQRAYRFLERRSRGARYELWVFTPQAVRDLLDRELATIAAFTGF